MSIKGSISKIWGDDTIIISYDNIPVTIYTTYHPSRETDWGYTEPEYDELEEFRDWDFKISLDDFIFDILPMVDEIPEEIYDGDEACKKWVKDNFDMVKEKYKENILDQYYEQAQIQAEDHANDQYVGYNESLNDKKGDKKMKKKLTEARWVYSIPEELATRLRKSINREDYESIKEAAKDIYDDIYNHLGGEIFDEDDLIQYKDEIDEVEPDEDEINYLLSNLYDFCDNLRIWIPTTGMFDDDDEEEESEFDFDDDIDLTWRDELEDDIYEDDLDEDMHEAEVHLDVDTEGDETEDDFRAKDPDKKILNEKPLKEAEEPHSRPNHEKLLDLMDEGVVDSRKLVENLLSWLSDDEIGDFIKYYEYDKFDVDTDYDDDDLDGMYEDDLDESLNEDTIKQNDKWVNKGEEGTHGTFKTKKAADEQRKAMFANGFEEAIDDSFDMPKELPESFLRTFQQEKPLDEGVNVNVNVEDNVTTTTTTTTPSEGELVPNDETRMSAEDMFVIDADDNVEDLEELI